MKYPEPLKRYSDLIARGSAGLLSGLVRAYQLFLSPLKPHTCRYAPTCSRYALEVLKTHSLGAAIKLIFRRLISCHPWGSYGYDPPPERPAPTPET